MKKLLKYLKKYRKDTYLTIIYAVLETLAQCFIPFVTASMIKSIQNGEGLDKLLNYSTILFICCVLALIFGGALGIHSSIASVGFSYNLRKEMFENIQKFSFQNIDKFNTSSLVTRMTSDISNVQMAFMMIIKTAVKSPLMVIFSLVMSFILSKELSMAFIITLPFLVAIFTFITLKAMPLFQKVFKKYDDLNAGIQENIRGIRVVKGFVRENYEINKFDLASKSIYKLFSKAETLVSVVDPTTTLVININIVLILYFGSYLLINDPQTQINVGILSTLVLYGIQMVFNIMMLIMVYVMIVIAYESSKRILEILSEKSTLDENLDGVTEVKNGDISFKNVCFKYNNKAQNYALKNINLEIKSGEVIGILGSTGSSKTTLIQLINRLYDVSAGSVMVGGVDVRDYNLKILRDNVAIVLQKNILFSGSIKENLKFGNENATDEEIIEVCRLAQAHQFIESTSNGYDTLLNQGGSNLSGGQKQRLCIARALLKKPKILILDDSTSALDNKTDNLLRNSLKNYLPEVTKIIVSQRISSIQDSDKIIIMNNGEVIDFGNHQELLSRSDIYRSTYDNQQKGASYEEK